MPRDNGTRNKYTKIRKRSQALTVDSTAAYASGDAVGDIFEIDDLVSGNYGGGYIRSFLVVDKSSQSASLDLLIFKSAPTDSDFVDNAAYNPVSSDIDNLVAIISMPSTQYSAVGTGATAGLVTDLDVPMIGKGSATFYGAVVSRGTPTYVNAADLRLELGIELDG